MLKYAVSMIDIIEVEHHGDRAGRGFVDFPFTLYANSPCWVPPFKRDMHRILARNHPLFEHAKGVFFTAFAGDKPAGRVAVIDKDPDGEAEDPRAANFCFFDSIDSEETAAALFEAAEAWARKRQISVMTGPGFSRGIYGRGVLVEGFEYCASMMLSGYNYRYYEKLIESAGYSTELDYLSAVIDVQTFLMPERISRIAEATEKRGRFEILKVSSKSELRRILSPLGEMYNETLGQPGEADRLAGGEAEAIKKDLLTITDHRLIKILTYDAKVVGFLFTFRDLSDALQRGKGKITPVRIFRLRRESRRSKDLVVNGIGILPEYQRLGGNALLYKELERTVRENVKNARVCELVRIPETAWLLLSDLQSLGARIHKKHRVYEKRL